MPLYITKKNYLFCTPWYSGEKRKNKKDKTNKKKHNIETHSSYILFLI